MKSLFDSETHSEILNRIAKLTESSQREWGKMEVAQMLRHCQFPLKVALGKFTIKKPNVVMRLLYKVFKKSMYDDRLWKKNLPTAPGLRVGDQRDFNEEKVKLVGLINDFFEERTKKTRDPHPAFGYLTYEQWGQMQYKHLDHHLRQFGV